MPPVVTGVRGAKRGRGSWPGPGRRSSRFKGVSWCQSSGKWRGQCWDGAKVGNADVTVHFGRASALPNQTLCALKSGPT